MTSKIKEWYEGLAEDLKPYGQTVMDTIEQAGDKIGKIDFNEDGQPDLTQLNRYVSKQVGTAAEETKGAIASLKESGAAFYDDAKPGLERAVEGAGNFLSNNKAGMIGMIGALLVATFMGAGPLVMLLLAAAAFAIGNIVSDDKGLASGLFKPKEAKDNSAQGQGQQQTQDQSPVQGQEQTQGQAAATEPAQPAAATSAAPTANQPEVQETLTSDTLAATHSLAPAMTKVTVSNRSNPDAVFGQSTGVATAVVPGIDGNMLMLNGSISEDGQHFEVSSIGTRINGTFMRSDIDTPVSLAIDKSGKINGNDNQLIPLKHQATDNIRTAMECAGHSEARLPISDPDKGGQASAQNIPQVVTNEVKR